MSEHTVSAFVLHRRLIGETSLYVTFLTQEKGLLKARVQGGRKQSKQAILEPFVPLWLVVDERLSHCYVKNVQVREAWGALPPFAVVPGLYLNELLYRFLHPGEEDQQIFSLYHNTLQCLMNAKSACEVEPLLRMFEWNLLKHSGALVSFTHEAYSALAIEPDSYYVLNSGLGFIHAETGFLGQHLLLIAAHHWHDDAVLKTAKRIMRCLIHEALDGAPIHARNLYMTNVGRT